MLYTLTYTHIFFFIYNSKQASLLVHYKRRFLTAAALGSVSYSTGGRGAPAGTSVSSPHLHLITAVSSAYARVLTLRCLGINIYMC